MRHKWEKVYCQICGNPMGNHDSDLTHVCWAHLNIVLVCHYCNFSSPSFVTLKKHVTDKHVGLLIQAVSVPEEEKLQVEATIQSAAYPQ